MRLTTQNMSISINAISRNGGNNLMGLSSKIVYAPKIIVLIRHMMIDHGDFGIPYFQAKNHWRSYKIYMYMYIHV